MRDLVLNNSVIVMIGTDLNTQGGISSVVQVLKAGGLFERCKIRYVASHCDGGLASKLLKALVGYCRFFGLLLLKRVALVHIHIASDGSFWRKLLFFITAQVWRIPIVLHLHGAEFHMFYERSRVPGTKRMVRHLFESANMVIVLSNSWQAWVKSRFPSARTSVLYNPVEIPPPVLMDYRERETLLFLGRIGERKGSFDLIAALSKLLEEFPHIKLLLGGDGEIELARQCAEKLSVEAHLEILGWVRGEEKRRLLGRASMYVLPSYNEGLPMSVLEAMAYGLPVVSTHVGGIPEAITDGVEGFLIEAGDIDALADRLALLLRDTKLRRRMGEAARRKVEATFSVGCIVPHLEAIYARLGAISISPTAAAPQTPRHFS